MRQIYAVVDTNVLVAALLSKNPESAVVGVVNRLYEDRFVPLYSKEIIAEYNDVLYRSKFRFNTKDVRTLVDIIMGLGNDVEAEHIPLPEDMPDSDDLPFYEVVLHEQDKGAFLVTGNQKRFPRKPFVITASEFLSILENHLKS